MNSFPGRSASAIFPTVATKEGETFLHYKRTVKNISSENKEKNKKNNNLKPA